MALALVTLVVDEQLSEEVSLPLSVASTADSARSVLSTVAAATMAFAGIAFSVTLLVFQMSSSQYSPRVIHGLFRDGFNKRIIGLVIGTFTYCLVVLRSVHGPLEGGADAAVPTFSVSVAVVLGVLSVLAIVGFIDHSARRMDVSQILEDVTATTKDAAHATWWPQDLDDRPPPPPPSERSATVAARRSGWVQQLDITGLLGALPDGATMVLATRPGRYAGSGTALAHVFAEDADPEALQEAVSKAVVVGASRTITQDPSYGLRQMVDVGLKALSPGVNDPTTAQDAIFHVAEALRELLVTDGPPARFVDDHGRVVVLDQPSDAELVDLAFAELRRAAAAQPAVTAYLLAAIESMAQCLDGTPRGPALREALQRQARLAVAESERAGTPEWDLQPLRSRLDAIEQP